MTGERGDRRLEPWLGAASRVELISTDVFDTLLLRTLRSERSRVMLGETLFSDILAREGLQLSADVLVEARLEAQRLAFRSMALSARRTEVRLTDVIARQLKLVGAPERLASDRLRIELEVERRSLRPNRRLAASLRRHRAAGGKVVAISDTTLSGDAVRDLIEAIHGSDVVDAVYSSADHGRTKRDGDLFDLVMREEGVRRGAWLHVGDDLIADFRAPTARGLAAVHLTRGAWRSQLRMADGAATEARRVVRRRLHRRDDARPDGGVVAFGRDVLGPVVVQFCQRIWLYSAQAEANDSAVLLFCARGGVGIQAAFERVLIKLDLPLRMRRETILISRLVAARAALLARRPSACEELNREFHGVALADVAKALGGRSYDLPPQWNRPFDGEQFLEMLFGATGAEVLAEVRAQNALFESHLQEITRGADRLILCDTGLYGSTQRLLASAYPHLRLETIQFARCNYKRHGEEHFPWTVGLMVERNRYSPIDVASCVLRYWQLVESVFEPLRPSVRVLSRDARGGVVANSGDLTFGAFDPSDGNALLQGVLRYVDALPLAGGGDVRSELDRAWRRLKRAIVRPTISELQCLDVGTRSVDFGRAGMVDVVDARAGGLRQRLSSIKRQLWREGAITREFPVLRHLLLPALELTHSMRAFTVRRSS